MARIPAEEVERLKAEISVERLVEARGIKLKKHGKDLIGLCPFHEDHAPSLVVTPSKNLWHCLGACQTGGSVVDWVMKAEGVSFRHAVELLRADAVSTACAPAPGAKLDAARTGRARVGRPPSMNPGSIRHSTVPRLPPPVALEADDQALLNQVAGYYHETLKESPEALAYLEKRGLRSAEMVERFKLGFANRTLGFRLPEKNRKAGAEIRSRLQRLGILRESGHEHFNGSLVIPIIDEHGNVQGMYGRKITYGLREGTPLHMYLPGPHKGVWNSAALSATKEVILCEALIDALTFWCAGLRNVTTSYGVEGFTNDHLEAFKRHGIERVLIAYDRDKAGDKAAQALSKRLVNEGFATYRVQFPHQMDANEYALKVQPATKSLEIAVRNAVWMGGRDTRAAAPAAAQVAAEPAKSDAEPASEHVSQTMPLPQSLSLAAKEKDEPPKADETAPQVQAANAAVVAAPTPTPAALPAATSDVLTEIAGDEVIIRFGDRRWRIRGLAKNLSYEVLRVNVLVGRNDAFHVDTFDLYAAKARASFAKQASDEIGIEEDAIKRDLANVLLRLEELQDAQIKKTMEPKTQAPELSEAERQDALALLKSPDLLGRILSDFEKCGVVGEETNKLVGYLAAVSRKLEEPLAVIIQSSSAAGKTRLMESILAFMPEEERVKYSAMTGQSLFYMSEKDLKHKILAIVEEEGAERASYALKLLQSEGELTIASTGKDPATGKLVTHEYRVEGPVAIILTTTAIDIDEELQNRCIVLTVDEDREQTRAIHKLQRESQTLEGLIAKKQRGQVLKLHHNAQRLLRPLSVLNPYAQRLTFLDDRTRTRRDHMKYLTLIQTIALVHQHQRPIRRSVIAGQDTEYVEVTVDDIAVANKLAHDVLGRSLDELSPQTRRLLALLDKMVADECGRQAFSRCDYRFTRRQIRLYTGWTDFQVKVHMHKLEDLEYVLVHNGSRGQSFVYELLYSGEGQDGRPFLMGLIDVEQLRCGYDEKKEHQKEDKEHANEQKEGSSSPQVAPKEGGGSIAENSVSPRIVGLKPNSTPEKPKNAYIGAPRPAKSYVLERRTHTDQPLPLAARLSAVTQG
jgi:DNA primase